MSTKNRVNGCYSHEASHIGFVHLVCFKDDYALIRTIFIAFINF